FLKQKRAIHVVLQEYRKFFDELSPISIRLREFVFGKVADRVREFVYKPMRRCITIERVLCPLQPVPELVELRPTLVYKNPLDYATQGRLRLRDINDVKALEFFRLPLATLQFNLNPADEVRLAGPDFTADHCDSHCRVAHDEV